MHGRTHKFPRRDGRRRAVLKAEGQVPDWVYFSDGDITVKNPTEEQVRAFARLAEAHGWSVQGGDGEAYGVDGVAAPAPAAKPGF